MSDNTDQVRALLTIAEQYGRTTEEVRTLLDGHFGGTADHLRIARQAVQDNPDRLILAIKQVRQATGMGAPDAKALVDRIHAERRSA